VLNRSTIDALAVAVADGLGAVAQQTIETANPPDAPPYGEGLVKRGGVLAYVGDKKVYGWGLDGKQPKKPRAFRVRGTGRQITAVGGFGFPAAFIEFGTIRHPARPFLTPALNRTLPEVPAIVAKHVKAVQ
jgi:hypothetical protein